MRTLVFICLLAALLLGACKEDDPSAGSFEWEYEGPRDQCVADAYDAYVEDASSCEAGPEDYQPETPDEDTWDTCISDDNVYHRIEDSISSIARVEAYDAIGDLLWNNPDIPTQDDFVQARILLDADEGLGSRLDRRYDVHYAPPADGSSCDDEGVAEANPDYCVGPATLRPIINAAFQDVADGNDPVKNAEVIHAAIQWFLYVSAVKEATTCTEKAKDCDSSWAYYTGGTDRDTPIGLAAEIEAIAPETHNRIYDGALAMRCWRDLDQGSPEAGETFGVAENLELRDQAIGQYDTALVQGIATLVRQKFAALGECVEDDDRLAMHAALNVLIPLLDRETRAREPQVADLLISEIAKEPSDVAYEAAIDAIDSVYLCP